jgi:stage V sporulation protein D (sporulation-specific penicillin-binding protein)
MSDTFEFRIRLVTFFILCITVLFVARLWWIQITNAEEYTKKAVGQYVSTSQSWFDRGTIFFKKKSGELVSGASLLRGFTISINPQLVQDSEKTYESLMTVLPDLDRDFFLKQVGAQGNYREIAQRISEDQASEITTLALPGITANRVNSRFSPSGFLAPHVIGFVGYQGNDLVGQYGIERHYNEILKREAAKTQVNFFAEIFAQLTTFDGPENQSEGDIIMTIEPSVQSSLQNELELIRERWQSDRTMGIIMDPKTGAVTAMASTPGFDINNYRNESIASFPNPNVQSVFEMGSIMKPIILATAIDQGAITADTSYVDAGFVRVGNRTINNFDKKGRGNITMQQVLNESLNTGMVFAMQRMEKEKFREQFERFGFGETTGIDLPGEIKGLVANLKTNRDVEFANIAFGQGIAATPIGMTRAMAVLANGGKAVQPRVVDAIEYVDGSRTFIEPVTVRSVIRPESSEEITRMMVTAFDSYFNGTKKMKNYSIAGKTGTAQIPDRVNGGYYTDRNLHTFVGYFPAYDPKFIIFLLNEYPKQGARFSSETLVDPFLNLSKFLINYYNIPPDR